MKNLSKIQIKFITALIFSMLISANLQLVLGQPRNADRDRFVTKNIELVRNSSPNEPDLLSVSMSDEQIFIGGRTGILRFIDLPQSGNMTNQPATPVSMSQDRMPLRQISFNNSKGYVLKGNSIYTPTNNGTWKGFYAHPIQTKPTVLTPELWNIGFPSFNSACIVGVNLRKNNGKDIVDSGLVICNQDLTVNPRNWTVPVLPDGFENGNIQSQLTAISFNKDHGWLVGANGIIWKTDNSGKRWEKEESNTDNPLLSVEAVSDDSAWAVGFNSTILHRGKPKPQKRQNENKKPDSNKNNKTDKKNKPTPTPEKTPQTLGQKVIEKGKEILGKDALGNVKVSENENDEPNQTENNKPTQNNEEFENNNTTEWNELKNNPLEGQNIRLWSVKFAPDKQHGWIIGDSGTVLYTENGGENWSKIELVQNNKNIFKPTDPTNLYSMYIDNNNCWIVGSNGLILRMGY